MKNVVLGIGLLLFAACEETPEKPVKKPIEWNQEKSTAFNKKAAMEEDIDIKLYLAQHTEYTTVESTGSGLRYIPIRTTEGELAKAGQDAKVQYKISLLDGTECYKTAKDELDIFRIDKSDIETGIQEGIKKMHVGERSKLIIPSHLAHGLIGDMDKIPPLTPIIVDIELIELN
jgi:FKBP-type peptidyl-prolyl cis-trans isomerase FkpA